MADKKKPKYETFTSPFGTFKFPKLSTPDTKFKDAGVYSVTLICDPADKGVQELIAEIDKGVDECLANAKANEASAIKKKKWETKYLPYADGVDKDEDGNEELNGTVEFKFNMTASGVSKKSGKPWKRSPAVFDSRGKPLPGSIEVWGGTTGYIAYQLVPYSQTIQTGASVKLALEAAMIRTLVAAGGHKDADAYGFETSDEGYKAPDVTGAVDAEGADDDDDEADKGDGDF